MRGHVGIFLTRLGSREVRLYFPTFTVGEKVFAGVSIFPHLCTTCTGGAHVHVDLAQTPHEILSGSVELPLEVERMVGQLLVAQEALNKETERLHSFVSMNCVPMH